MACRPPHSVIGAVLVPDLLARKCPPYRPSASSMTSPGCASRSAEVRSELFETRMRRTAGAGHASGELGVGATVGEGLDDVGATGTFVARPLPMINTIGTSSQRR